MEDWGSSRLPFSSYNIHRQPLPVLIVSAGYPSGPHPYNLCQLNGLMTDGEGGGGPFQEGENTERGLIEGIFTVPLLQHQ